MSFCGLILGVENGGEQVVKKALVLNDLDDTDGGGREDERAAIQILLCFCRCIFSTKISFWWDYHLLITYHLFLFSMNCKFDNKEYGILSDLTIFI